MSFPVRQVRCCPAAAALLLAAATAVPSARAEDVVRLKTGVSFSGRIVAENEKEVTIETPGGHLTFPRSQIKSMRREGAAGMQLPGAGGGAGAAFTDDQLRAYYRAHPDEFAGDPAIRFVVRRFSPDAPREAIEENWRQVKEQPDALDASKAGPWVSKEMLAAKFAPDAVDQILHLSDGAVSDILEALDGSTVFVRVVSHRAGAALPFEQVKDRVRERLAQAKARDATDRPGAATGGHGLKEPPSDYVHQGPLDDLVVRVGPGGVPRRLPPVGLLPSRDYEFYLRRAAQRLGKAPGALTAPERRQAVDLAVDDELVFQGALADGLLKDEYVRWRILESWRAQETRSGVTPQAFSEEELQAYYKAHPEQFTEPAGVLVEQADVPAGLVGEERLKALAAVRANPDGAAWRQVGWIKEGDNLPSDFLQAVSNLREGAMTEVIDAPGGIKSVFRVKTRREPRLMPFNAGKVRFAMTGAKVKENEGKLAEDAAKEGAGLGPEEALFRRALQHGAAREAQIYLYIMNAYLDRKKMPPEKPAPGLLDELRARFRVERPVPDDQLPGIGGR